MEEKKFEGMTAGEMAVQKPDYEKEIAGVIRSNLSPKAMKDRLMITMKTILRLLLKK